MQSTAASRAWTIVLMLFAFMLLNFADKAVLGLSAVPIMRDLGLNHTQFGLIGTSFFAFFSLGAVLVGFLVNRVPTKWVLAAMALIWSLCQLPMLLATSWSALLASRVVLGLGEGPAYPVALHSAFKWFPNERRPPADESYCPRWRGRHGHHRTRGRLRHSHLVLADGIRPAWHAWPRLVRGLAGRCPRGADHRRRHALHGTGRDGGALSPPSHLRHGAGRAYPRLLRLLAVAGYAVGLRHVVAEHLQRGGHGADFIAPACVRNDSGGVMVGQPRTRSPRTPSL